MNFSQAYYGRSGARGGPGGAGITFAPNLRRDRVSFVGDLRDPLRFREGISALHAVVVGDLKYKPKDKSAYQAYLKRTKDRENALRAAVFQQAHKAALAVAEKPMPAGLEGRFRAARGEYWNARAKYSDYLAKNDPALFRVLVPCDPVVTVAPDVLFFECFSKDESSYGCLTVDRDAFDASERTSLGTTNVDYSLGLYEQFQRLRTYRRTEFAVDPKGFEVSTEGAPEYREEKIDLPPSWLRGFGQLQAAMALPTRKVRVTREGLYSVLAFLKRHRATASPRAVRFELNPGSPAEIVLEPWEARIVLHDRPYDGPRAETIRVWGRDRLLALARMLPIADDAEVHLLGTGLPSFWSVRGGPVRFLLGLSGWTANDWTSGGGALADLAPPVEPDGVVLADVAAAFREVPTRSFADVVRQTRAAPAVVAAALNRYALLGQLIHDLGAGVYRWRQILPAELSATQVKIDSPEAEAAREIVARGGVKLTRDDRVAGLRTLVGRVDSKEIEALLDADGKLVRGQCSCSHYFRFKLRAGPCRHMQALRRAAAGGLPPTTLEQWYKAVLG